MKESMKSVVMKEKLHRFIETVEEKRMKAIYTLFEKEIEEEEWEYTDEFKEELDRRYEHFISGGITVSAEDANKRINELATKIRYK